MKTRLINLLFFSILVSGLLCCKTYYIPIESFKQQFNGIDSSDLQWVHTRGPYGEVVQYLANPIEYIKCVDKQGNPFELKNSPSIEIRFTKNNNKKTIYYFDRIYLLDTLIIGDRSRFIGLRKGISINEVKLIEVQDGKKNYHYVE
jgi:hypothetical protein